MHCITLLSDFGLQDPSVAIAKGILMQHLADAEIVDVSHNVEPFQLQQAAYLTQISYHHFPAGTVHLLLFDVFADNHPRLTLCEYKGHYFLAPDNGILPLALHAELTNVWNCFEMQPSHSFKDWLHQAAIVASTIFEGGHEGLPFAPCQLKNAPHHGQTKVDENGIECRVIHIDRFENVVINLTRAEFEEHGKGRPFSIQFMRDEEISNLSRTYFEVSEGDKLCRFNSEGYLEICINRGKAASLFGFKLHREKQLIYSTIKISFGERQPPRMPQPRTVLRSRP